MKAYCFKCRASKDIKNPKQVTLKNKRPADQRRVSDLRDHRVQDRKSVEQRPGKHRSELGAEGEPWARVLARSGA